MAKLLERILREGGVPDLLEILGERLAPTDLQSLLLEVFRRRAARQTPAGLLEQYEKNRFVRPSILDPRDLSEFDRIAFSVAAPQFEPIEISPVAPLGTCSSVAPLDQNLSVATVRNTEVVSDATNVLALECALRRRALLHSDPRNRDRVRLCVSQRHLRPQKFDHPSLFAHFRIFALVTAGRDEGSHRFESEAFREHLDFHLRLFAALRESGFSIGAARVAISLLDSTIPFEVDSLVATYPDVRFDVGPSASQGYYEILRFKLFAEDRLGTEHEIGDGGFTDWTRKLLSNKKERLLISGLGTERVCQVFH